MIKSRTVGYAMGCALALSILPTPGALAATSISCPGTATFKIAAQNPAGGWTPRAPDIAASATLSQTLQLAPARWLLICTYDVHGAKGLISREVQFAMCRTLDQATVSSTAKFVCN